MTTTPEPRRAGFATRAVHTGQEPDALVGAVVPPPYLTSTFVHDGVGNVRGGFDYGRSGNPTRAALEQALADLEGGDRGFAFSSGMSAEDTLVRAVPRPGDHVVLPNDVYGGTYRLLVTVLREWGIEVDFAAVDSAESVAHALRPGRTRLVWLETPSNPTLRIADVAAVAALARDAGALLVVDNTFASPYLQNPLALGADAVVHSTTKYVGGHSDVSGGAVVVPAEVTLPAGRVGPTGTPLLGDAIAHLQNAAGSGASPFDAWLTHRGLKTLPLRMEKHCTNALVVARHLEQRPEVREVLYPGLPSHPGHQLAARQMRGFGGMVSVRLAGAEAALTFCAATRLFALAVSLGGVESLIEYPARMTHLSAAGSPVSPLADLVRLSVGVEDSDDLVADLDQALDTLS